MADAIAQSASARSQQLPIALTCVECGRRYPAEKQRYTCDCGSLLDVTHDLGALQGVATRELFDSRLGARRLPFSSGVWRFAELVYPGAEGRAVSGPEGNTNLYRSERLAKSWYCWT